MERSHRPSGVLRIGIVEDHESQVYGVKAILAETDDLVLVANGATVAELLAITSDLDLVVLDLRLADGSTPKSNVEQLRAAGLEALVVTSAEEPYLVQSAAQAAVLGVVRKSARAEELVTAIRAAAQGQQVTTMDWAAAIDLDDTFVVKLSPRQQQVLSLYAMGESAARVASQTGLAADTVNLYLSRIRQKYAEAGHPAPTKADLVRHAIATGVAPTPRGLWRKKK
ncbi:LuxR C-terminal-related transcriptional regulator [Antrihabitans sp. YC2-6]|uniref:LuxR C-terminal-related transcriptional regulator n=1 Tax=Antrihabitans sp. YC2-6 TaxID=2799498 RepID=UPI0018F6A295|nr:LuxR C-terminal-related transcriptional regulator [Antrihabitans sp. YC2-6]MBJ8347597.1 response regulator transcription factor [Antrihabitans sp. YC2-6]